MEKGRQIRKPITVNCGFIPLFAALMNHRTMLWNSPPHTVRDLSPSLVQFCK